MPDPTPYLAFVERVGVPAAFLIALLVGCFFLAKAILAMVRECAAFLAPRVERLVEAAEANSRAVVGANEKLNNLGGLIEWHHDEMTGSGRELTAKIAQAASDAAAARTAAETALGVLRGEK